MPGISLPPLCTLDLGQVGNDLPLDKTSPFKPVPGDVALWRKAKGEACIGQCFSENKSPKPKRNFHRPTSGPPTQGVLPRRRDSGSKRPPRSIECGGLCIYASPDSPSGQRRMHSLSAAYGRRVGCERRFFALHFFLSRVFFTFSLDIRAGIAYNVIRRLQV